MRSTGVSLTTPAFAATAAAGGAAPAHEKLGRRRNLSLEAQIHRADAVHLAAMLQDAQQRRGPRLLAAAAVRDHLLRARFRQRRKRIVTERERVGDGLHDCGLRRQFLESRLTLARI